MPVDKEILNHAEFYIQRGFKILPVNKFNKRPLTARGSHDASDKMEQIKNWFTEFPDANIAIATGKVSGIAVIDVDNRPNKDGFTELEKEFCDDLEIDFDNDLIVLTPSGGFHLYYRYEEGFKNAANILPGVDRRGDGGYVVAPPSSRNIKGVEAEYTWNNIDNDIPVIPTWVKQLIKKVGSISPATKKSFDVERIMRGITEGERDTALHGYACHLRGLEIPYELAHGFMGEAAHRCIPPFDPVLAEKKIEYVYSNSRFASKKEKIQAKIELMKKNKEDRDGSA